MSGFKAHQINLYQDVADAGTDAKFQILAPDTDSGEVVMKKAGSFAAVDMQMKFKLSGRAVSNYNVDDVGEAIYKNHSTAQFEMNMDSKAAARTGTASNGYDLSIDDKSKGEIFNRIEADHQLAANMDTFSTQMHNDVFRGSKNRGAKSLNEDLEDVETFLDEHADFFKTGAGYNGDDPANITPGARESIKVILDTKRLTTMADQSYEFAQDIKTSYAKLGDLLGISENTDLDDWSKESTLINQPSGGTKASIYGSVNILSSAEYAHLDLSHTVSHNKYQLGTGDSHAVYTSRKEVSTQIEERREALEQALKADIEDLNATEARLEARIDNVISNSDSAALDSLTELMTVFQNSDGSVVNSISSVRAKVDDIVDTLNNLLAGLNGNETTLMTYCNGTTSKGITAAEASAASTATWIAANDDASSGTITGQTTTENNASTAASTQVHNDVNTADTEQQPGVQL